MKINNTLLLIQLLCFLVGTIGVFTCSDNNILLLSRVLFGISTGIGIYVILKFIGRL